jgi:hypothetical protein
MDRAEIELPVVSRYVRYLADHTRLKDWVFDVEFNERLVKSLATAQIVKGRKFCLICVGPLFMESEPDDQRYGIVHELVHCHHEGLRACVSTLPDNDATRLLRLNHSDHLESATDQLAMAIAAGLATMEKFEVSKKRVSKTSMVPEQNQA